MQNNTYCLLLFSLHWSLPHGSSSVTIFHHSCWLYSSSDFTLLLSFYQSCRYKIKLGYGWTKLCKYPQRKHTCIVVLWIVKLHVFKIASIWISALQHFMPNPRFNVFNPTKFCKTRTVSHIFCWHLAVPGRGGNVTLIALGNKTFCHLEKCWELVLGQWKQFVKTIWFHLVCPESSKLIPQQKSLSTVTCFSSTHTLSSLQSSLVHLIVSIITPATEGRFSHAFDIGRVRARVADKD